MLAPRNSTREPMAELLTEHEKGIVTVMDTSKTDEIPLLVESIG